MTFYNTRRPHSALDPQKPDDAYWNSLDQATRSMKPKPDTPWKRCKPVRKTGTTSLARHLTLWPDGATLATTPEASDAVEASAET